MKILVTGSRYWKDKALIKRVLSIYPEDSVVMQGGAKGADFLAMQATKELGMVVMTFEAQWNTYGKAAGPIRNREMLDMKPDVVLAFHDDLENSKGTLDCVNEAEHRGILVRYFSHGMELD